MPVIEKKHIKKVLKYALISLGSLIVLFFATCFIIVFFYEQEIKDYIVAAINKNLRTEIKVDQINFTLLKKFPDASVEFSSVLMRSTKDLRKADFKDYKTDTLLSAKKIFLQFNILDIFNKRYKLKKIQIEKGRICLFADNSGRDNFHFWKPDKSSDTSSFQLKLKKITFKDIQFLFVDKAKKITLSAHSKYFVLSGDFSSDSYAMSTSGELFADKFTMDDVNFIKSEDLSVDLNLKVHNNEFLIEKGLLKVADFKLAISGKIKIDKKNSIDLFIKGKDIDIQSFISLLPDKYSRFKEDYDSEGNFYFETHILGTPDSVNFVHLETKFGIKNGTVSKNDSKLKLTDVCLEGMYSNGIENTATSSFLKLDNFKAAIGTSKISGIFLLQNFNHYKIDFNAIADIKLNEAQDFFHFDTIQSIDGTMKANVKFSGNINNPKKFSTEDFRNSVSSGTLILEKVNLNLKNQPVHYTGINGIFTFDNNDLEINSLQLKVQDNDFTIHGMLRNVLCYFMIPDQKYSVEGDVRCSKLNVGQLLRENSSNSKTDIKVILPEDISFNVSLDVKDFVFDKFNAKNVVSYVSYNSHTFTIENISFQTLQGNLSGSATITQNAAENLLIKMNSKLQNIDIQNLFTVFNNFGQNFIQDKNLKGLVTAEVNLSSEWKNNLTCDMKKLVVVSNVVINNGELNDFKPMEELARFVDLNELKNIRFSEIKNDIFIKDEKITIPQMDINSSAMNVTLSGEQTFDSKIDYRLKVLLSDVLFKKAGKSKKENEEFGVIEDDGLGRKSLYLIISGTTDNFKIRYDTKKVKENIKEAVKEEKMNLKNILNEEFGLFKKDSAMIIAKKKKEEEEKLKKKKKVQIKWEEDAEGEKDKSDEK